MHFLPLITDYIRKHSGLEGNRNYLGMSQIADCPVQLYLRYKQGIKVDDAGHRNAYRGYMMENEIKKILQRTGVMKPLSERALIAPWDERYQGHTDGETVEGNLLEIKTMSKMRFDQLKESKRMPTKHYFQVQTYLKYGGYGSAADVVIAVPETFDFMVLNVAQNYKVQNDLEEKAKNVLMHIDAGRVPACECGRCDRRMIGP